MRSPCCDRCRTTGNWRCGSSRFREARWTQSSHSRGWKRYGRESARPANGHEPSPAPTTDNRSAAFLNGGYYEQVIGYCEDRRGECYHVVGHHGAIGGGG